MKTEEDIKLRKILRDLTLRAKKSINITDRAVQAGKAYKKIIGIVKKAEKEAYKEGSKNA